MRTQNNRSDKSASLTVDPEAYRQLAVVAIISKELERGRRDQAGFKLDNVLGCTISNPQILTLPANRDAKLAGSRSDEWAAFVLTPSCGHQNTGVERKYECLAKAQRLNVVRLRHGSLQLQQQTGHAHVSGAFPPSRVDAPTCGSCRVPMLKSNYSQRHASKCECSIEVVVIVGGSAAMFLPSHDCVPGLLD
jgi:hypothetical protein